MMNHFQQMMMPPDCDLENSVGRVLATLLQSSGRDAGSHSRQKKRGRQSVYLSMNVAIVGSEDFRSRKAALKAIRFILPRGRFDGIILTGSAEWQADLRVIADELGVACHETPSEKSRKGIRKIVELADFCLAFTNDGFAPEGDAYNVVQKFSEACKPVDVIHVGANGNARKIMKLRYYNVGNGAKSSVSVMIVSSVAHPLRPTVRRADSLL